ncbi:heme oxygenase-like protein [Lentithecium fluviatile CBS 122367]|uniref:Heme oxygenase-like protein n=1 Tax=Lentithecium fluviatile CBS 122367 TaxID=1168545 RepID=A0A6G1J8J3_9PLEO|nr:heme oxygenase-like protein [Lentithecium fluviatile CBS 122367]
MAKDSVPPISLPGEINIATRALHTELNRLITTRLPLGLPPFAADPTLYTTGLLHFAHIYLTFESLWADLLPATLPGPAASPPTSPLLSFLLVNPYSEPELFTSPPSPHIVAFLHTLRPKGLIRSGRLKRDLEFLTGLHPTDFEVLLAQYPGDKVAEFCTHIRRRVGNKPHVLVAYAWCYYMAVFSGGRYLRAELLKAGNAFWNTGTEDEVPKEDKETLRLEDKGLSFWSFPGQHDGLDIKEAFKARLEAAETLLTPDERVDIIEEAKTIFKLSASLVEELDQKLGTDLEKLKLFNAAQRHQVEKISDQSVTVTPNMAKTVGTWLHRPEVTGTVVALGCLACVALLRFGY